MNIKNLVYCFGLNAILLLFITISLNSPVTAQKDKKPKREKFGSSLKKKGKEPKTDSKPKVQNGKVDEDEKILVNTDLILNDILVLNQKGETVFGLKQSDFIIIEDEKPQEIELFSSPDKPSTLPRYFVFIIDHSNSHNDEHIRNSINAAKLFVDKLAPQDNMAIVTDDVKLKQDFTNDKKKLKNQLDSVYKSYQSHYRAAGYGYTYTALFTVLNEMFDKEGIRPIVIMQSVGRELYMLKDGKSDASRSEFGLYYGFHNFTFEDILRKIIEKRVTVYSIVTGRRFAGLSDKEKIENLVLMQIDYQYDWTPVKLESIVPLDKATDHPFVRRIMQDYLEFQLALIELAETSGGTVNFLQTPEDAKTIYSDIFSSVDNRYLIAYYSTNQEQNNKLRNVKIEVRGHPEYVIVGRKTYIPR